MFRRIGISQRKFRFAKLAQDIQHVESPAALFRGQPLEGENSNILFADGFRRDEFSISNYGNSCVRRNRMKQNVASNPARTTCVRAESISFLNGRERKGEARNQYQVLD